MAADTPKFKMVDGKLVPGVYCEHEPVCKSAEECVARNKLEPDPPINWQRGVKGG